MHTTKFYKEVSVNTDLFALIQRNMSKQFLKRKVEKKIGATIEAFEKPCLQSNVKRQKR